MLQQETVSDTCQGNACCLETDPDSLKSSDIHHDHPKCSSINYRPLETNSVQQPMVITYLMADSELAQHDAEPRLSVGMHHSDFQNNDNNCGGRDSPIKTDAKNTSEINVNSISEITEHNDQVGANNVSQEIKTMGAYQRRCWRPEKVPDPLLNSLESKESTGSSVEVVTTLLNGSGEVIPPGCLKNTLERESDTGDVTSQNVEVDMLVGIPLGGCSDLKRASVDGKNGAEMDNSKDDRDGSAMDLSVQDISGEDFDQGKSANLNVDQNVLSYVRSPDKLLEEATRFHKGRIGSDDQSGQDPVNEPMEQKRLSKFKDACSSLAELDEMKDVATQTVNTEMLQSSLGSSLSGDFRKKLLVLDVNGLLADVVPYVPDKYNPDIIIGRKAVFKRPFCDDFLQFCFERFNVGVWSSRTKRNVEMVIDFLMGESRSNLLFCWDQSHCTTTGFNTLENKQKPLVLKELSKLWEKHDPDLPWENGDYNESNTLLLDDSPYKALRNPPNTAIFPNTYQYKDEKDNSLGPGGDLRVYLEGLASVEHVQKYVEQNPYGQRQITKSNSSWGFYLKVMGANSNKQEDSAHHHPDPEHASTVDNNGIATEEESRKRTTRTPLSENFEQSKRMKLNGQFEECRKFCEGETSLDNKCGKEIPTDPLKQKRQPVMSLGRGIGVSPKRKLLVLDVNGLLVDIVSYGPDGYKADTKIGDKGVFKRPFCDDFLKFCFERFKVGFWLTTTRRNLRSNLEFILGRTMEHLLFGWDISHCFDTGFSNVENRNRTIILKELRRLWEKYEPNLPWRRGEFDESNTLLLDTYPHTALLNPPYTSIFPNRYRFRDEKDNSLGPGGDLRVYLEGLAAAENVQEYVKNNPFGQRPITERNPSWNYYLKVIDSASSQIQRCYSANWNERWWY